MVFDANAYGYARPDLDQLERLAARLAGIGVKTWVPETVAWEWAEHLVLDWQILKNAASTERWRLQQAGLSVPVSDYPDRDEVIAAVLANLAKIPNVEIIELTGRSAIEGLKDQVLLRSPAKLKGARAADPSTGEKESRGVKTGASDSAWIRDVLERAAPDEIVIVSGDRDVLAAFTAWNKSAPEMRRLEDLRPTLFDFTVDDGHARSAIIRYLRDQLPAQLDSDPIGIGRIEGLERAYARTRDGDGTSMSSYGASVTYLLALAGVDNVMIEVDEPSASAATRRGNPRVDPGTARHETVYATVEFLASGETTVQSLWNGGDPEVEVISIPNVLVRAHLSFEFADGVITFMDADSEADAVILDDFYWVEGELEESLVEALNRVLGIRLDLNRDSLDGLEISIPGTDAHVELTTNKYGDGRWDAEVTLWTGGEEVRTREGAVGAEWAPSPGWDDAVGAPSMAATAANVWGEGVYADHGLVSLAAWLIERIEWPRFPTLAAQPEEAAGDDPAGD
ncbi:hypothetical protein ACIQUV_01390 [Streptomyces globosus]|uniref:hypothetical protein n=1 Tax=Streptomyces globosus TaxID=68209 RepID=UPI0038037E53